ncbi:SUMO-activating enzyme subunit aos-1 [Astathelohania contejeani]|uniref:SUMO-activating enzyme subunit aos-1 n=1 Tax=Astathelohania contejeani TaxID=164912 RepID=A0ABQ7HZF6_9MICR|nr:SUMO-activating enzyme subunit aos-1 [Thelohania contejeani]
MSFEKITDEQRKYDRQIRLFGIKTQNKIENCKIVVLSTTEELVSGEILKNFALLGVTDIITNRSSYKSFLSIAPNDFITINNNIKHNIIDNINSYMNFESSNIIYIFVDHIGMTSLNSFFICSKCYSYRKTYEHKCKKVTGTPPIMQCLIGAIFVQEIVKYIKGDDYCEQYHLNLE